MILHVRFLRMQDFQLIEYHLPMFQMRHLVPAHWMQYAPVMQHFLVMQLLLLSLIPQIPDQHVCFRCSAVQRFPAVPAYDFALLLN